MTPTGRRWIVGGVVIVGMGGALLLKGFLSLDSGASARRFHHRPAEASRSESRARQPPNEVRRETDIPPDPRLGSALVPGRPTNPPESVPAGGRGAPASEPEYVLAPETPETIAARKTAHERLDGALHRNPGNEIAFLDCAEQPCRARAQASSLEVLTAFLRDVSGSYDGHLAVDLRERLDPFMGRSFEADLLLGTNRTEAVPTEPLVHE